MNTIKVLDCTLRDGGYCNKWNFGFYNEKKILERLTKAGIDIIECGFLTDKVDYDIDNTRFSNLEQITALLPKKEKECLYVAMVNYGEYNDANLPIYDGKSLDGIRVAFHKKDLPESLKLCKRIKNKGYKVFVQAMVSLNYSDDEFLFMLKQINKLLPEAFYIVDSFGMMKKKDLMRLFYMVEHNLNENIWIGFHSHNNMQLAYSNAQSLVDIQTSRNLIIDSSVYGMGRGAGNLNTELFVGYLNENRKKEYKLNPLLSIIDEILNEFYQRNYWGYSLPNYLAATHNAHPSYAEYLDDKKTLTVENMNEIFGLMDNSQKVSYDSEYIEELYQNYMKNGRVQNEHIFELRKRLKGKRILLIAPGKSSFEERDKIAEFARQEDVITISVNFDYIYCDIDLIFISNLRRFRELDKGKLNKCIATSNLPVEGTYAQVEYSELLNKNPAVRDNAGLMAIMFLIIYEAAEINLAGYDGYSHDESENYISRELEIKMRNSVLDAMNEGMKQKIKEMSKKIKINFLTKNIRFIQ